MFALAHLSDLHLSARPRPLDLARQTRARLHQLASRTETHVPQRSARGDHARSEKPRRRPHCGHRRSGQFLGAAPNTCEPARGSKRSERRLPSPSFPAIMISTCRKRNRWPAEYWGDYMRGDDGAAAGTFPFLRRRGAIALIALSSALPTAAVFGDRPARRPAARAAWPRRSTQNRDLYPRRPRPSSAGEPAEPAYAAAHRRRASFARSWPKKALNSFCTAMIIVSP